MSDYTSFLICFHKEHTDIYREGMPLGVIREGLFSPHLHLLADGSTKPVEVDHELLCAVDDVLKVMRI